MSSSGGGDSAACRNWSALPPDLIACIHSKLRLLPDHLRFRAVCRWWRISTPPSPAGPRVPWLLLPYDAPRCSSRRFYSPADRDVHVLPLPAAAVGSRCCGSTLGWLLLLSPTPLVSLLNPLTRGSLTLPPLTSFPGVAAFRPHPTAGSEYVLSDSGALCRVTARDMQRLFLRKAVLSSDPAADPDALLLALRFNSRRLAFCRVRGAASWAEVEVPESFGAALDVAHHRGRFYLSCSTGRVVACDLSGDTARLSLVTPVIATGCNSYYILSTPAGDLLLITRCVEGIYSQWRPSSISRTTQFRVFRLDLCGDGSGAEIESLGDYLVFLGMNHSICIPAAAAPCGLKAGRIYFVDMNIAKGKLGLYDVCAFDVDSRTTELLFRDIYSLEDQWTLTGWMMPNLG